MSTSTSGASASATSSLTSSSTSIRTCSSSRVSVSVSVGEGLGEGQGQGEEQGRPEQSPHQTQPTSPALCSLPLCTLPAPRSAAERRARITVRLPDALHKELHTHAALARPVLEVWRWLASALSHQLERLVASYALLHWSACPPVELADLELTLHEAGVRGGDSLMLRPRKAAVTAAPPRQRGRPKSPPGGGLARQGSGGPAATLISLAEGRLVGTLCGRYTFVDTAFERAGMLVLVVEAGLAGAGLLTRLQPKLRFLSFGLQLHAMRRTFFGDDDDEGEEWRAARAERAVAAAEEGAEQVRVALQALQEQSGSGFVRCIVGHGTAADACLAYARRYGSPTSEPGSRTPPPARPHPPVLPPPTPRPYGGSRC